jgi:hypothetical protein
MELEGKQAIMTGTYLSFDLSDSGSRDEGATHGGRQKRREMAGCEGV